MKTLCFLLAFIPLVSFAQIEGDWYTSFAIAGTSARVKMNIVMEEPSVIALTDLDGKFEGQEMQNHTIDGNSISFQWDAIGLQFEGEYDLAKNTISGSMSQGGMEWDVTFSKEPMDAVEVKRPQEPKPPFEYQVEELKISNGDVTLGATLTLPKNFSESTRIVVLASGSGAQNRDCEILGHKPFHVIADHLAKNGIGCLRFDDRGTGESTGTYIGTGLDALGSDVVACVKFLRKKKKFKKNKIGIAGHSEGGAHALIAATEYKKIDFLIELASIGGSAPDILIEQQYLIPIQAGEVEEAARWNQATYQGIVDILKQEGDHTDALTTFLGKHYDEAPDEYKEGTTRGSFMMGLIMMFNNDWGREFAQFNAQDYLQQIELPILAINGEKDIQVPAVSNSAGFKSYENSKCFIISGLNHLMQTCDTCTVTEYGELEETFSLEVLEIMVAFILER